MSVFLPHECDDWHDGECSQCDRLAEIIATIAVIESGVDVDPEWPD